MTLIQEHGVFEGERFNISFVGENSMSNWRYKGRRRGGSVGLAMGKNAMQWSSASTKKFLVRTVTLWDSCAAAMPARRARILILKVVNIVKLKLLYWK